MAGRGEFFRSYHLPVLLAEQNDSQFEEINIIDDSQEENRPVPVQEAEIRWKFPWLAVMFAVLSGRSKDSPRTHSLSRLGGLHVKADYVSTLLAG